MDTASNLWFQFEVTLLPNFNEDQLRVRIVQLQFHAQIGLTEELILKWHVSLDFKIEACKLSE